MIAKRHWPTFIQDLSASSISQRLMCLDAIAAGASHVLASMIGRGERQSKGWTVFSCRKPSKAMSVASRARTCLDLQKTAEMAKGNGRDWNRDGRLRFVDSRLSRRDVTTLPREWVALEAGKEKLC